MKNKTVEIRKLLNSKIVILLVCAFAHASPSNIKLLDVIEQKISTSGVLYKITASSKTYNYQKKKNLDVIWNKEKFVKNNFYYLNGTFEMKDLSIKFQKGYFLEAKFYMLNTEGYYKKEKFKSQKIVFSDNLLQFKNVFLEKSNKKYRKIDYSIFLD